MPHRSDSTASLAPLRSETRDGMRIYWDVPIEMDDGIVLRCDVFRPEGPGRYPVLLGAVPYAKWLSFRMRFGAASGRCSVLMKRRF